MAKPAEQEYVVDGEGKRKAVILPVEEYERLLEDLHDLTVAAERRDEPAASLEEVRTRLRADGLL
jgi:PHD/YefM family antitoxin component YafN of YafNO toxin-antitoxin module